MAVKFEVSGKPPRPTREWGASRVVRPSRWISIVFPLSDVDRRVFNRYSDPYEHAICIFIACTCLGGHFEDFHQHGRLNTNSPPRQLSTNYARRQQYIFPRPACWQRPILESLMLISDSCPNRYYRTPPALDASVGRHRNTN